MKWIHRLLLLFLFFVLPCSCAQKNDIFTAVGASIASPSSLAVNVAENRLYVVNSNSKVLYRAEEGNFQTYNITNPLAPVLLGTAQTKSFSGEIYLDIAGKTAWVPNRYSAQSNSVLSQLLKINIDESAGPVPTLTESTLDRDGYSIACCYPARRAWISTTLDRIDYVDLDGNRTPSSISLLPPLSNGGSLVSAPINHVLLKGNQAFLSRTGGGVMIVNLDEAAVPGVQPVDYLIYDIDNARGLATDGALLYVVGEGDVGSDYRRYLAIIDPFSLTPSATNTSAKMVSRNDIGILVKLIDVNENPQEVLLTSKYAFVTNQNSKNVTVIDLATRTKVKDIIVGEEPFSMALYKTGAGEEKYLYVGNLFSDTISIIDIASLAVVATLQ